MSATFGHPQSGYPPPPGYPQPGYHQPYQPGSYQYYPGAPHQYYQPPGDVGPRIGRTLLLGVFIGGLVAAVVVAAVVLLVRAAAPPGPGCPDPDQPCADPPRVPPRVLGTLYTNAALGYQLEYDAALWEVVEQGERGLVLSAGRGSVLLAVQGAAVNEAGADGLLQARVDRLSQQVLGFAPDGDPLKQFLGQPMVGYRDGVGGVYSGTVDTPQGPGANIAAAVLAASDGEVSVVVSVVAEEDVREAAYAAVDSIMNSFRWPTELR